MVEDLPEDQLKLVKEQDFGIVKHEIELDYDYWTAGKTKSIIEKTFAKFLKKFLQSKSYMQLCQKDPLIYLPHSLRSDILVRKITHVYRPTGINQTCLYSTHEFERKLLSLEAFDRPSHFRCKILTRAHQEHYNSPFFFYVQKNKNIATVVNKTDSIDTTFRFFKMEVLAGEDNMITEVVGILQHFFFNFLLYSNQAIFLVERKWMQVQV